MEYLDYYKTKLDINDYVNMDYQKGEFANKGRIVGFTPQKVKVYNSYEDKTFYIKSKNLTLITKFKKEN